MLNLEQFKDRFQKIKGKTIAIVYIFEGDDSDGFNHFFIWKSSILTKWLNAIEEIHCLPFIVDVRTFVSKAMNHTLPHIDFILNMNSGTYDLSTMALVPSTCSALGIPCIPCNAVTIVTGENKKLSNLIANSTGINVPKSIDAANPNGIYRPINLGNSLGVTRGINSNSKDGIYQEFIQGFDITTPIVYNGMSQHMELLPTVLYVPESSDYNWFNGENAKKTRSGYTFKTICLDKQTETKYLELAESLGIKTFCRIDARVKCTSDKYINTNNLELSFNDIYFVEINVMPTIRDNNNFAYSFNEINEEHSFYSCKMAQKSLMGDINVHSFLLVNSIFALLK